MAKNTAYSKIMRDRADQLYEEWAQLWKENKLTKAAEVWKKYEYHVTMCYKLTVEEDKFRKGPRKLQPKADEETDSTVTNPIAKKYLKEQDVRS